MLTEPSASFAVPTAVSPMCLFKTAPDIIFVMQSIDTLITYGKRICGYRMGMKDIYDRKPILKPTQYGMIKSKQIAKNLGKF